MSETRTLASTWNTPDWAAFYESRRHTTSEIYASEWTFLKGQLRDGMSVLDIGCAVGGLASVIGEHVTAFEYTGLDLSDAMIARAREKHPGRVFHVVPEADLACVAGQTFDLVVCFGVLHLTRRWRELLAAAWARTGDCLLFDLRETSEPTVEDEARSHYVVDALLGTGSGARLPYNVVNTSEALATVVRACDGAQDLCEFGYLAPPSQAAVTTVDHVLMHTYQVRRRPR